MTHLTAFLCPLARRGQWTPVGRGARPPQAGRNAASGQRNAACGGPEWPPGCPMGLRAALARCARHRASHRAYPGGHFGPSNESLSMTFGITGDLHRCPSCQGRPIAADQQVRPKRSLWPGPDHAVCYRHRQSGAGSAGPMSVSPRRERRSGAHKSALTTSRRSVVRGRPKVLANGMNGSVSAHSHQSCRLRSAGHRAHTSPEWSQSTCCASVIARHNYRITTN